MASIMKKVVLIPTLPSAASNLMVNKNSVSEEAKLLIQLQFKTSTLPFFSAVFPSLAAAFIVDLFIYVFVFTHCLGVFLFFLSFLQGKGVFLHFSPLTSCGIWCAHYLSVI